MNHRILVLARHAHAPWKFGERMIVRNFVSALSMTFKVKLVTTYSYLHHAKEESSTFLPYGQNDFDTLRITLNNMNLMGDFDIVHFAFLSYPVCSALLRLLPIFSNKIVGIHCALVKHPDFHAIRRAKERMGMISSLATCDYAIATSRLVKEWLTSMSPKAVVHYVPPAVDVSVFRPLSVETDVRYYLGLESDDKVVAYVGHLIPDRVPVERMIRLARGLDRTGARTKLVLVAPHTRGNVKWSKQLQAAAQDSGIRDSLRIVVRDFGEQILSRIYNLSSIVLLPFRVPSAVDPPVTLLEAMACGRVVVVSDAQSMPDVVHNGVNGFVLDMDSPDWVKKFLEILNMTPELTDIRSNARKTILSHYSIESVGRRLAEIFPQSRSG